MVETDALGAAELADDLHNCVLLLWREHVLAVMNSVVGAIAATKERANNPSILMFQAAHSPLFVNTRYDFLTLAMRHP